MLIMFHRGTGGDMYKGMLDQNSPNKTIVLPLSLNSHINTSYYPISWTGSTLCEVSVLSLRLDIMQNSLYQYISIFFNQKPNTRQ